MYGFIEGQKKATARFVANPAGDKRTVSQIASFLLPMKKIKLNNNRRGYTDLAATLAQVDEQSPYFCNSSI